MRKREKSTFSNLLLNHEKCRDFLWFCENFSGAVSCPKVHPQLCVPFFLIHAILGNRCDIGFKGKKRKKNNKKTHEIFSVCLSFWWRRDVTSHFVYASFFYSIKETTSEQNSGKKIFQKQKNHHFYLGFVQQWAPPPNVLRTKNLMTTGKEMSFSKLYDFIIDARWWWNKN